MDIPTNSFNTANASLNKPSPPFSELTPEEKNNTVDQALDRVNDVKSNRQSARDATRATIVELSTAKQQADNVELYIEQSTNTEINSTPSIGPAEALEFAQKQQRNDFIQTAATSNITAEQIREQRQELQRQALQDKLDQISGEGQNTPSIDTKA